MNTKEIKKAVQAEQNKETLHKVSTSGVTEQVTSEQEKRKVESINDIIIKSLNLPTIEEDATFAPLYKLAKQTGNDTQANLILGAWKASEEVKSALDVDFQTIVEKCVDINLSAALALVEEWSKKEGVGGVVFKPSIKDGKPEDLRSVTLTIQGEQKTISSYIVTYKAEEMNTQKRVACLASAYRLIRNSSKGVKSLDDYKKEFGQVVAVLLSRGLSREELVAMIG